MRMPRAAWFTIGLGMLLIAAAGVVKIALETQADSLPVYMTLPDLSFTDQEGHTFRMNQIKGKTVVLGTIYTHCPDICPMITARMKQIQQQVAAEGLSEEVFFVTITFDPERDTPEVLRRYAQVYRADLRNWVFLTGDPAAIRQLTQALGIYTERVGGTPGPSGTEPVYFINHTDRIFLADRQGQVRALLPGSRTAPGEAMETIRRLVRERSTS